MPNRYSATEVRSLILTSPPALTEHPAMVYLSGLGEGSQRTMRQGLNMIAQILSAGEADALTLDWAALRYKHTAALRSALAQKYSPATANKMLGGLRRVLREALLLDLISPEDYQKAIAIKGIKIHASEPRGRALSRAEITALLDICRNDANELMGSRDLALLAILRGGGLRREEAVHLCLCDLDQKTGALKVRNGKGGKDRTVYLPEKLLALVTDWLKLRGNSKGALLCHIRKGGIIVVRSLTPQAVWFILEKRAKQAGVEDFSPHDLRRTYISDLLDAGIDLVTVQDMAGHSYPGTTARYDRRGERRKMEAAKALDL